MDISEEIEKYIIDHSDKEDALLYELFRETHKKVLHPRMISGYLQGKLLEMLTKMIKPHNVLEIGTYTGYSAICIAKGLEKDSKLTTIEVNDELEEFIRHYIEKSGQQHKISLLIGSALQIIPTLNTKFDLIFIDGDKREYPDYLKLSKPKLKPGGVIIADNVLWDGKVTQEAKKDDEHTRGIKEFNDMMQQDMDLENLILPLRDGLTIARKR